MRLKLVHHSQTRPIASPENEGFDLREIRTLLERLEKLGVSSEIVDTMTTSDEERTDLYLQATLPTARKKYQVRQVFGSKRHAGYLFGREVPALLIYEPGKPYPVDVYPHRSRGRGATIRAFLESLVNTLKKAPVVVERRRANRALVERMDRLREKIGPIGVRVVELVREAASHAIRLRKLLLSCSRRVSSSWLWSSLEFSPWRCAGNCQRMMAHT